MAGQRGHAPSMIRQLLSFSNNRREPAEVKPCFLVCFTPRGLAEYASASTWEPSPALHICEWEEAIRLRSSDSEYPPNASPTNQRRCGSPANRTRVVPTP